MIAARKPSRKQLAAFIKAEAELQGCSTATVRRHMLRLGLVAAKVRGRAWTDEDDLVVRAGYVARRPAAELAAELARTPSSVQQRALLLGVGQRAKWSTAHDALIVARYGKAQTGQLAAELGRSHKAVKLRALKLGVASTPRRHPARMRQRALHLARSGLTFTAIAQELGLGVMTVSKWCRAAGVQSADTHLSGAAKRLEAAVQLVTSGRALAHEAAERLGVGRARLGRALRDGGYKRAGGGTNSRWVKVEPTQVAL